MENETPQVPMGDLPILNFIRQKYLPASLATATIRMTTMEIAEQVTEHTGQLLPPELIYQWLVQNGYTYDTIGDMRFEWLMKDAE